MDIDQPIRLRPRFECQTHWTKKQLLDRLTSLKDKYKGMFRFIQSGDHLWIHHLKTSEKIYTPHLHLEIVETDSDITIKGLYSPNSSYWTFFMFMHFILACLFIGSAIIGYSFAVMNHSYDLYIYLMVLSVILWIAFYIFARLNRKKGLPQAEKLNQVFKEWVDHSNA